MPKKTPMRMCVGCRNMFPKRDLIRIVRPIEGSVAIDLTGKASGRGADLCKNHQCFDRAVKSKALERALERKLDGELLERLGRELEHG